MISIIITSFKEPKTIYKAIKSIAQKDYSGIPQDFEIIQISPDKETLDEGMRAALDLGIKERFKQIVDPHKGKPFALNLGFKEARGEIIVLTDGDVYFEENAIPALLEPFQIKEVGGVTGQPVPQNQRNNYWGYLAHCFTAAANHKRKNVFTYREGEFYVSEGKPFPLSGYIFAMRNIAMKLPSDVILDDSYISYKIFNEKFRLAYAPNAKARVVFPTNLTDYMKQRRRNLSGHIDLKKHADLGSYKNDRSFIAELKYLLYPIRFAKSAKEFIWALSMYPLRLLSWVEVFKIRATGSQIMKKTGWDRIGSTK